MNDTTTSLRIEGRPTAVAERMVYFGSLAVALAADAPTPNLQTHCVMHARLQREGGALVWRQVDSAFQVIGHVAVERAQDDKPSESVAANQAQTPSQASNAAPMEQATATRTATPQRPPVEAPAKEVGEAASSQRHLGAGGNVSPFQRVAQSRPSSPDASPAPSQAKTAAAEGTASAPAQGDPYGNLVSRQQATRSTPAADQPAPAASAARAAPASLGGAGKPSSGGSAFAQLVGSGAARTHASPGGAAAPNTGFRADEDDGLGDVPF
jgi:hypothetical protein